MSFKDNLTLTYFTLKETDIERLEEPESTEHPNYKFQKRRENSHGKGWIEIWHRNYSAIPHR